MSFDAELAAAAGEQIRARIDGLKHELAGARAHNTALEREVDVLRKVADVAGRPLKPPKWLAPKRSKTDDLRSIVCTILSDTHFDEVIDPLEIGEINAYNRHIAEMRLERYFEGVVKLTKHHLAHLTYEGIVMMLGGDLVSGDIHDELTETNEGTSLETVLHWAEQVAAGIRLLADEFGSVYVPVVVGNHGRRTRKPRAKKRARDNLDWLMAQMIAGYFKADDRVTFDITDGTDVPFMVYDTRFLLTHGDQVGGGQGIGGIWPPVMRMRARKLNRYEFDTIVLGHFHQLIMAPTAGVIVNGSLKGFDEYAAVNNFQPERAQQALWLVAPERGCTFSAPVHVDSRREEAW